MELELIEKQVKQIGENLNTFKSSIDEMAKKSGVDAAEAHRIANEVKSKIDSMTFATPEDLKAFGTEMQKQFDELAAISKKADANRPETKGLDLSLIHI